MDEHQMDHLTRGLWRAIDRRTGVRGLLAVGASALGIAATGTDETTAKGKGQKRQVSAQGP